MSDVNNTPDEIEENEIFESEQETESVEDMVSEELNDTEESEATEIPEGTNLMQALIDAQKEAQSNKDGWQRARAEFANYKKRVERERIEMFQTCLT